MVDADLVQPFVTGKKWPKRYSLFPISVLLRSIENTYLLRSEPSRFIFDVYWTSGLEMIVKSGPQELFDRWLYRVDFFILYSIPHNTP